MEKLIPEKIVIVVGDRKNHHAHHIKLEGIVRVGRAMSSDVILSDEHVEPLQLVFFLQEDTRKVQVMPGVNPVLRNGEVVAAGIYDFVSGDEWNMGHTSLQAFHESHVPEPTEKLVMKEYRGSSVVQQVIFVVMLFALLGLELFTHWIKEYEELDWVQLSATSITDGNLLLVFLWAGLWAVIARMVAGRSQFIIHFVAASLFVFADMAITTAFEYLSYGTHHDFFWDILGYVVMTLLLALLLYIAFSYALNLHHTKRVALAVGIFFSGFLYIDSLIDLNQLEPDFNDFVKPPFAILVEPQTVEQFSRDMDKTFAEVDELAR